MANPNDTSKPARSRRNQPKASAAPPSATQPAPSLTLEQVIENERTLLLQVRAMLHCLYEVLLYADDDDSIMHAEVAHTAARLIDDSCVRMDSVNLRPLFEAIRQGGSGAPREDEPDLTSDRPNQVREPMPVYLA
jgi:hypothetical protein